MVSSLLFAPFRLLSMKKKVNYIHDKQSRKTTLFLSISVCAVSGYPASSFKKVVWILYMGFSSCSIYSTVSSCRIGCLWIKKVSSEACQKWKSSKFPSFASFADRMFFQYPVLSMFPDKSWKHVYLPVFSWDAEYVGRCRRRRTSVPIFLFCLPRWTFPGKEEWEAVCDFLFFLGLWFDALHKLLWKQSSFGIDADRIYVPSRTSLRFFVLFIWDASDTYFRPFLFQFPEYGCIQPSVFRRR